MRALACGALLISLVAPRSAWAQEPSSGTTTSTLAEVPSQDIIPEPGGGVAPDEAGDRGGALQLAVLALVVAGVAVVVVLIVRQSRRARAGGAER